MFKKYINFFVILGCIQFNTAQKNINNYKYVVLPLKYDFLNEDDKYRLNTLTRHLFKSEGFVTYFDQEDLPEDLFSNRCLAMYGDVIKEKAFLTTKVFIELRDCRGDLILKSMPGRSKIKEYEKAYNQAIREAFESLRPFNYSYTPNATTETKDLATKDDEKEAELERLRQEVATLKTEKEQTEKTTSVAVTPPYVETPPKPEAPTIPKIAQPKANMYMYAGKRFELQARSEGGYHLTDSNDAVIYKLLPTSQKAVYIAVGGFKQGVAVIDGKKITVEFYDTSNSLITERYLQE